MVVNTAFQKFCPTLQEIQGVVDLKKSEDLDSVSCTLHCMGQQIFSAGQNLAPSNIFIMVFFSGNQTNGRSSEGNLGKF